MELNCTMTFGLFLPAPQSVPPPLVWCLAGLSCNDENFAVKSGAQKYAAQLNLALVMPDTSPRGQQVTDHKRWDLVQGAGFYLDATQQSWSSHYRMSSYLINELPALLRSDFPLADRQGILGHSMGGHGALTLALRHPERFSSVSAIAPIVNPSQTPWGQRAFSHYLGDECQAWSAYDACQLVEKLMQPLPIRLDQGLSDPFYPKDLQPEQFIHAAERAGVDARLYWHQGNDHSYFFISSIIDQQLDFHARHLRSHSDHPR